MTDQDIWFELVSPNVPDLELVYGVHHRDLVRLAYLVLGKSDSAVAVVDEAFVGLATTSSERPAELEVLRLMVAECEKTHQPTGETVVDQLHQRVLELPVQERWVLGLRYLRGLDDHRIAQVLGKHAGSVIRLHGDAMATLSLDPGSLMNLRFDLRRAVAIVSTPNHWAKIEARSRVEDAVEEPARRRLAWPAAVGSILLMAFLWSTGSSSEPTPSELAEAKLAPAPELVTVTRVDNALLLDGEEIVLAKPLVVLGASAPDPEFDLTTLGTEVPFGPIVDLEAAVTQVTGAKAERLVGRSFEGSIVIDKVTLIGWFEGRLIWTVWFAGNETEPLGCMAVVDDDEITVLQCIRASGSLSASYQELATERLSVLYSADRGSLYTTQLPPGTSVVSVIDTDRREWQRPIGGISVTQSSLSASETARVAMSDRDGNELAFLTARGDGLGAPATFAAIRAFVGPVVGLDPLGAPIEILPNDLPVVLVFGGTGCPACAGVIDVVRDTADSTAAGVRWVFVSVDNEWDPTWVAGGWDHDVVRPRDKRDFNYGDSVPLAVVLDSEHRVLGRVLGVATPDLPATLLRFLEKAPADAGR